MLDLEFNFLIIYQIIPKWLENWKLMVPVRKCVNITHTITHTIQSLESSYTSKNNLSNGLEISLSMYMPVQILYPMCVCVTYRKHYMKNVRYCDFDN